MRDGPCIPIPEPMLLLLCCLYRQDRVLLAVIFFWLELNWPSSQYWIHLLIKFYLRCPNSWTRVLCDLGLCERPTFLTVSSITPLLACTHCPRCFLVLKNFLPLKAAHFDILCLFTQGFLCLKFFIHSISTHPSRPQSNVISSVKSPLIPSSRVNNSLLRFPTVLCTHQKYSLRAFFISVQFFCLYIFAFVTVLFDRQGLNHHFCILTLCYWID